MRDTTPRCFKSFFYITHGVGARRGRRLRSSWNCTIELLRYHVVERNLLPGLRNLLYPAAAELPLKCLVALALELLSWAISADIAVPPQYPGQQQQLYPSYAGQQYPGGYYQQQQYGYPMQQYTDGYITQQYPGAYIPQQFGPITATIINPMVTTIKDAVSTWDWDFILPSQPVQPNPIPLQTSGTLTFQVALRKNARGGLPPEGVFNIQANLQITTSAQTYGIIISELGVTLQGQNQITPTIRAPAVSCTPDQFHPLPPGYNQMFCTVLFQNVVLYGQTQGQGGITFPGYTLTPYVTWVPKLKHHCSRHPATYCNTIPGIPYNAHDPPVYQ